MSLPGQTEQIDFLKMSGLTPDFNGFGRPEAGPGYTAAGRGADIHRHQFAQLAARADNELVWFATIVHRLRWRAEGGEGIDQSRFADRGATSDTDMFD
jgi:hypothetical protein